MPTDLTHLYKRLLFGEYKIAMRSPAENLHVIIIIVLFLFNVITLNSKKKNSG